jgi:TonB family protein
MAQPPTAEPGPSKADASASGGLRAQPQDIHFETDLAQLAAVFSAHGGGVSRELSNDLALEIVLNEIVVQACLSTGATGAAIGLLRDGEMVCRARDGATAPALGSRLDLASGLSGECIRTQQIQRIDDVVDDPRVDREVWQRLGVRSVMVMPLIRGKELIELFELFSAEPQAFGERDERTLEALAARIFSSLERAARPLPGPAPLPILAQREPVERNVETPVHKPVAVSEDREMAPRIAAQAIRPNSVSASSLAADPTIAHGAILGLRAEDWVSREPVRDSSERGVEMLTWALRGAVLVCAIFLGLLLGRHLPTQTPVVHSVAPPAAVKASETNVPSSDTNAPPEKQGIAEVSPPPSAPAKSVAKDVPAGGLRIFENGKEIFHMPPAQNGATSNPVGSVERASSAEPDNSIAPLPAVAAGTLLYRVEPEYPEGARRLGIEGAVVLDVHIGGDGAVQNVQLVSGPPELAQTSIGAVKQWRFQPRRVNGRPAPMQTTITLNFKLPQ